MALIRRICIPTGRTRVERTRLSAHHLILYDGLCGLCNRLNTFVLRHDAQDRFRFASQQSPLGQALLVRHVKDPRALDTLYVVEDHGRPGGRFLEKGRAGLFILHELGGLWRGSTLLRMLPRAALDALYDVVARNRFHWFGRFDACPLPSRRTRAKFLDV